ncbi:MAG: hypothetical protein IBX45_00560 [Campylobacterales bacterium]|nr:hypothetical protein [Campylobacterales bacterium]
MGKSLFALCFLANSVFALSLETIRTWYAEGAYEKVCSHETTALYETYTDNEEFVNMYGHACVEIDMISRTVNPINKLIRSPETRANAAYFATVLYQKKLLYHAFVDKVDISYVRLPRTPHILSVIFDKYVTNDFVKEGNVFIFKESEQLSHHLHVRLTGDDIYKLIVQTYSDGKLIRTRAYW